MHSTSPLPEVVNVAHPHPVDLYNVLSNLNEVLGNRLKVVSLQDWVNELEALSAASLARVLEEYVRESRNQYVGVVLNVGCSLPSNS